jgi:D-3-phosphoglycerate dehydrogenase
MPRFTIVFFCLFACAGSVQETAELGNKIIQDKILLSGISDGIEYVILDKGTDAVIYGVDKLIYENDRFFILDNSYTETLAVYTDSGKHLFSLEIGLGGPDEFIEISDFDYDPVSREIFVFSGAQRKIFVFDENGKIIGYDENNPLSNEGGKVKLLKELDLKGDIYGIGDGHSDFQLKEFGMIKKFYAFTENIERKTVAEKADHVTPSFDEFLYVNNLPRAISYPKNRILCLVIGDVPDLAIQTLKKDGFSIRHKKTFEEKYVPDVGMMLLANGELLEREKLERAVKLKTIGYLGNSEPKLSHGLCTDMGIVIFDDPKHSPKNPEFIAKRMVNFINHGHTFVSANFPNLQLPRISGAHRLIHIHKNMPGIMAQINKVFADHHINIVGQYLMTNPSIGYVITDVSDEYDKKVLKALKQIDHTIKFRILY